MAITKRKPISLDRDIKPLRDTKLFFLACDDRYAPKQYFDFFKIPRIKITTVVTEDGTSSAPYVLKRLLSVKRTPSTGHEKDDELWMLLDTDHCIKGSHIANFIKTLKDARKRGIKIALSKPCFEIWLLLHYVDEHKISEISNASETEDALRLKLPNYDKTKLKADHFPISKVVDACLRAKKIAKHQRGGLIPVGNMSDVYLIWKAIVRDSIPSQLDPVILSINQ